MSRRHADVLVVGAGRAGLAVVETIAQAGSDLDVTLVGGERHPTYERPQVSKRLLARDSGTGAGSCVVPGARLLAGARHLDVRLGRAVAEIDIAARVASLDDGRMVSFATLVLATGTRARTLPGLPPDAAGVHALRTADDAGRLRDAARDEGSVTIVGGGFIGMEAASSLAADGVDVTLVEAGALPMAGALPESLARTLAARAQDAGVHLHTGAGIVGVHEPDDPHARQLVLATGERIAAPVVLVAIGSIPHSPLGDHPAGLRVDATGRCTELPATFACGDVAAWHWGGIDQHVRIEHWLTAAGQGRAVGRAILGTAAPYDEAPFFWSDQFGVRVQRIGHAVGGGTWAPHDRAGDDAAVLLDPAGQQSCLAAIDRPDLVAAWRRAA